MEAESHLRFSPYRLDIKNERLLRDQALIRLRPKPFSLLCYLANHAGRLVTHDELRKAIWPSTFVGEGVLRLYLREVRVALEDDADAPRFIETIPRRGYRFVAEVTRTGDVALPEPVSIEATPADVPV
jgi:DNA-binding winged helix-turn-helix (wHTH) protein